MEFTKIIEGIEQGKKYRISFTYYRLVTDRFSYNSLGDLELIFDSTYNSITNVIVSNANEESWYTLDGRKLKMKPTQKGIYVVNGKKVVIR